MRDLQIKISEFKISELEALPPDKREEILRRCLESEEYAVSQRRIRLVTFVVFVAAALILINIIAWTGIVGEKYWLGAVFSVGIVVLFIALMIYAQIQLTIRLLRKLVRKEADHA
jgi:hypothetical protein